MKLLIIDNGSLYLEKLKSLVSGHTQTIKKYSEIIFSDKEDYDLIILSGGHTLSVIGHESDFSKELNLIRTTSTPLLGICLGFELIASSYGAWLEKLDSKENKTLELHPIDNDPIFTNLSVIKVFESHRWVITKESDKLIGLAMSKDGIEIIKHKQKLIYGFQFHPEMFEDITQGDELFANFMKIVENIEA